MSQAAQTDTPEWVEQLRAWRQGDYTTDLKSAITVEGFEDGIPDVRDGDAEGVIVTSQTCDIVNSGPGREYVTVVPLIKATEGMVADAEKGVTPNLAALETPPAPDIVADLNRPFSVRKEFLAGQARSAGFVSDARRARFADALARKAGRFAFPDDFARHVLGSIRERARKAAGKDSDQGKAYASIASIRASAHPGWDDADVAIGFFFILEPEDRRPATIPQIRTVLADHLKAIKWPQGFRAADDGGFEIVSIDDLTAGQYAGSQPVDLDYLSWASV